MTISLAKQVDILFKHGRDQGLPATYRAVAEVTGETANNLFRIRHGQNRNPGLRTISALVNYFDTDLGYLSCKTKASCLNYLNRTVLPQTKRSSLLPNRIKRVSIRHNRRTGSR
jgi:hypothetical protein